MIYRLVFLYFSVVHAELEMVQVLVRHGDRAPSFTFPSDEPHFDVSVHFPRGFSQLTKKGFEQAKEFGHFLKNRYSDFIDFSRFNRKLTKFRSSDKDRCIETSIGITNGLFPNELVVPVHSYGDYKQDLLLKPTSVKCLRAARLVSDDRKALNSKISAENLEFFNFLSKKTGWKVDGLKISDVFNVIYRKNANKVPLDDWITPEILKNVTELKRKFRMEQFNSGEKAKLTTGFLLSEISRKIDNFSAEESEKLLIFTTHDATVTSFLYSLGVSDHQLVPYLGAVLVETHRIGGRRFVKILYRTSPSSPPKELQLPNCSILCPIDVFNRHIASRIILNRQQHDVLCENSKKIDNFGEKLEKIDNFAENLEKIDNYAEKLEKIDNLAEKMEKVDNFGEKNQFLEKIEEAENFFSPLLFGSLSFLDLISSHKISKI